MSHLNPSIKYHLIIGGLISLWIFVFILLIRSFDDVELVPVYPGSENLSATEWKKCFKEHVAKLVG
ncbi:hypothetical protein [Aquimarina spongiae]|uniref:Uncharacterized protein n=1 Tax=Aquimarina spongiae TaxID=570521 RepID=A0A1M6I4C4_9FLAO|nr:hypothetical protein [Aquimarina spongiae]SHJ29265.1 hypothetical protein SAMN04488508_107107 [Aquimarina spongiae]